MITKLCEVYLSDSNTFWFCAVVLVTAKISLGEVIAVLRKLVKEMQVDLGPAMMSVYDDILVLLRRYLIF